MFTRPARVARALASVVFFCSLTEAVFAAHRPMGQTLGMPRTQGFALPLGRGSGTIRLRDFAAPQRLREPLKPLEIPTAPKALETAFPTFSNPLHRHRMATLPTLAIPSLGDLAF